MKHKTLILLAFFALVACKKETDQDIKPEPKLSIPANYATILKGKWEPINTGYRFEFKSDTLCFEYPKAVYRTEIHSDFIHLRAIELNTGELKYIPLSINQDGTINLYHLKHGHIK